MIDLADLRTRLDAAPLHRVEGRLVQAIGPLLEAELPGAVVGAVCTAGEDRLCEVVGFRGRRALLMPLMPTEGIPFGAPIRHHASAIHARVGDDLVGRVLDGLGRPLDGGPQLTGSPRAVRSLPPPALTREPIQQLLPTGLRVLDGALSLGRGQRVAILAGSGVGKSTLLGQLARQVEVDLTVLCLVGERSREVREFLDRDLGPDGLSHSVVVAATAEQPPAVQVKAAFVATAIAEHFRDRGRHVLLCVDSLTRFAMAQRQIGLAAGEPPTSRGYTPSVFALLPQLLERAGPGAGGVGSMTGIYSVLVEGDDIHDPIGDAVRGIVDGHVVLSRRLAMHGHFPAIDMIASLSRVMPRVVRPEHASLAARLRDDLATWDENEELIRLGAYRAGSNPHLDEVIARRPQVERFLRQQTDEQVSLQQTLDALEQLFS